MKPISLYIRAFFTALSLTVRGEKWPEPRYPEWLAWAQQTMDFISAVYRAFDQQGLNQEKRQALMLTLDRRLLSVETLLAGIEHHAAREYPSLLIEAGLYNLAAVQASNVNDLYGLSRLEELNELQLPPIQMALSRLKSHLEAVPPVPDH